MQDHRLGLCSLLFAALIFSAPISIAQDAPKTDPAKTPGDGKDKPPAPKPDPKPEPGKSPETPAGKAPGAAPDAEKTPEKTPEGDTRPISLSPAERRADSLFPMSGGRLTYSMTVQRITPGQSAEDTADVGRSPLELRRTETVNLEGKEHSVFEWRVKGEVRQREFYRLDEDRLVVSRRIFGPKEHAKVFDIDPPQVVLPAEVKPKQTWSWKGSVGKIQSTCQYKVVEEVELKLMERSWRCVVIEASYTGDDGSEGTSKRWYCPGVGLIKEILEVRTQEETFRSEVIVDSISSEKKP